MKRRHILTLAALCLVLLSACAGNTATPDASAEATEPAGSIAGEKQGFLFTAGETDMYISMPAAPILAALPQPNDVFEEPSCAFDGVDITYFYNGFELTTYPHNGEEYILSIILTDDSISTPENVYIGGSLDSVVAGYGDGYTQNGSQYTYTSGKGELVFSIADDDSVTGIRYSLIID